MSIRLSRCDLIFFFQDRKLELGRANLSAPVWREGDWWPMPIRDLIRRSPAAKSRVFLAAIGLKFKQALAAQSDTSFMNRTRNTSVFVAVLALAVAAFAADA